MRILVVRAHPLDATISRSMQLADAFLDAFTDSHPDADIQDLRLYDVAVPEIDVDLLTGWRALRGGTAFSQLSESQQNKITLFNTHTQNFLDADVVVIANPLWNLSIPTRLKAWIDTVVVAGKTFRYSKTGQPEGLAHGKRVVHLQSSGGHFNAQDPASQYIDTILGFLGCKVTTLTAEGMDHEPDRAEEIMADAVERARQLAASL
ncbi:FMN-dependent NADH-azoreductase [Trueperella pecoris]|uniref:FMN-dependent NADH-azoreductase n=1 Tax=Trueperella pecoris TaxID=2733571 RepID=UPI00186B8A0B|nr:NAD(P)H-dependent oxidoreductase [Trueperella pecoris]QOQ38260.1 FMN-dependent NADH-azoreductase [Trueperella pecoris]